MFGRKPGYTDEDRDHFAMLVPCFFCGGHHNRECPRVREVHLDTAGKILVAKYWQKWDRSSVIFPEDLEEEVRVSVWRNVWSSLVMAKRKTSDKIKDWFWTSSYLSWASRLVVFAVTTTAVILLVVGLLALAIKAIHAL